MTYETDIEFLEEFERWKGEKKVTASDLSPSAFLVDRAKDGAWKKVQAIEDNLDRWRAALEDGVTLDPSSILEEIRKALDE